MDVRTEFRSAPLVLVVERDTGFADSLASEFSDAGYVVRTASTLGDMTVALNQMVPDVLVLDLHAPGLTGARVLERLRSEARTHLLPVLTLSSRFREAHEAIDQGADGCLIKPLLPNAVVDAADLLLDRTLEWLPQPELVRT